MTCFLYHSRNLSREAAGAGSSGARAFRGGCRISVPSSHTIDAENHFPVLGVARTLAYPHLCVRIHAYLYMATCTHACTYACTHACTHECMHTGTHAILPAKQHREAVARVVRRAHSMGHNMFLPRTHQEIAPRQVSCHLYNGDMHTNMHS